jgi:hypothetical protein
VRTDFRHFLHHQKVTKKSPTPYCLSARSWSRVISLQGFTHHARRFAMGENRSYPITPQGVGSTLRRTGRIPPCAGHIISCITHHGPLIGDTRACTASRVPITHTTVRQEGDGVSGAEGTGQGSQAPDEKRFHNSHPGAYVSLSSIANRCHNQPRPLIFGDRHCRALHHDIFPITRPEAIQTLLYR